MSKKDVENYYNKITNDYTEMLETLKEMEELAAQDIINPDKVEEIKQAILPLKNNYMALSWVMFLLNKPVKKYKQERYKKCYTKKINNIDPENSRSPEALHNENKKIIDSLNSLWSKE